MSLAAVAVVVTVLMLVDPEPAPVMLGIALTGSLGRSQLERTARGRLEALAALPVFGLVSIAVGALLHALPWVGAAVYTAVLVGAVLLRRFGATARRLGGLVAMPFVALLFLPPGAGRDHGPVLAVVEPVLIAVLSWAAVTAAQLLARRIGLLPRTAGDAVGASGPSRASPSTGERSRPRRRLDASTRIALQLAISLVAAFAVGLVVFPAYWAWVVMSTVIVAFGARGRGDALSTGVHRLVGAGLGTLVALVPLASVDPAPSTLAALALASIGVGVVVRGAGYALWAFALTVALALLERLTGQPSPLIGVRLTEILVGVAIGVLPAVLVLPVRSADVIRSRLGPLLAATSDRLAADSPDAAREAEARIAAADRALAPAARPLREAATIARLLRRRIPRAAAWVEDARELARRACAGPAPAPGAERRVVGEARRALRDPDALGAALRAALAPRTVDP